MEEKTFTVEVGKDNMEVRKVLLRSDGIKYLIIPKHSTFEKNDYVKIIKLKEVIN